ncbi:hypothetical protein Tco_0671882 [Tanacetum coccineum]
MKELLEALPTVTASVNGETLIVYLAASEESISAVSMAERGKASSCVFRQPNITWGRARIPGIRKAHTSPRICRYKAANIFSSSPHPGSKRQAHKIDPHKAENQRRISQMAIKLGEQIKNGEAKRKEPESENAWKLFTSGASSSDGSEAGLMLVDSEGKEYTYALRLSTSSKSSQRALRSKATSHKVIHGKGKGPARSPSRSTTGKSITQKEVTNVTQEEEDNWMIPIREFLQLGKLPDDPQKARNYDAESSTAKIFISKRYTKDHVECTQDYDG